MLLYIVRHGIAIDREDPKCPSDPERYLTPDGIKRTRDVAKSVAALIDEAEFFVSSPYVRAMQTLIAESTAGECVGLYCAQLMDLSVVGNTFRTASG